MLPEIDVDDIYGSQYLKADDLKPGQRVQLVITKVEQIELPARGNDPARKRLALHFDGKTKRLVLNATNARVLKEALGSLVATWVGAKVTLARTTTSYAGSAVPALRIENPVAATPTPPATPESAAFVATDGDVPF